MPAPKGTTLEGRFWAKVARSDDPDGCWEWTGCRFNNGYGQIRINHRNRGTHRVSWELHYGSIPAGTWVLHRCDNKACVCPDHLFLGTHDDNIADMVAKGRQRSGLALHPERSACGERNGNAKLTVDAVRDIRRRSANGETQRSLAAAYGVAQSLIGSIVRRRIWRHVHDDDNLTSRG